PPPRSTLFPYTTLFRSNPCIKAAVYRATDEGNEMVGIRRGWGGLLNFNPDDKRSHDEHIIPLTKANTRTIDRTGGTYLHTSRTRSEEHTSELQSLRHLV